MIQGISYYLNWLGIKAMSKLHSCEHKYCLCNMQVKQRVASLNADAKMVCKLKWYGIVGNTALNYTRKLHQ